MVIIFASCFSYFLTRGKWPVRSIFLDFTRYLILFSIFLLPPIIWIFYRKMWGIESWFKIDSSLFARLHERIESGQWKEIVHYTLIRSRWLQIFGLNVAALLIYQRLQRNRLVKLSRCGMGLVGNLIVLAVSVMYMTALAFVYLSTPFDPKWQLTTSIPRTIYICYMLPIWSTYFLTRNILDMCPIHRNC